MGAGARDRFASTAELLRQLGPHRLRSVLEVGQEQAPPLERFTLEALAECRVIGTRALDARGTGARGHDDAADCEPRARRCFHPETPS